MSPPSRTRHTWGAVAPAAALLTAGGMAAPAQGHAPAERAALEARVQAVRQALKAAAASPDAQAPSWTVAQATNWTNWPKWSKWSNWANK